MYHCTVPSQAIFTVFQGSQKGIAYKDLVCGIVLLTHGRPEEKRKCECGNGGSGR